MGLEIGPGKSSTAKSKKKASLKASLTGNKEPKASITKKPESSSSPSRPSAPPVAEGPKKSPIRRLEQNPDSLPSNSEASRDIVGTQGSASRRLIGKLKEAKGTSSDSPATSTSPVEERAVEPQIFVHPDTARDFEVSDFELPSSEPDPEQAVEPQILVHPEFDRSDTRGIDSELLEDRPELPELDAPSSRGPNSDLPHYNRETTTEDSAAASEETAEDRPSTADSLLDGARNFFGRGVDAVEGGLDRIRENVETRRAEAAADEAQFQEDAEIAYAQFSENPTGLSQDIDEDGLAGYSDPERFALAQVADEHEAVGRSASDAIMQDVERYENFEDIPSDIGSQILLQRYSGDEEGEKLSSLLEDHFAQELSNEIDRLGRNDVDGDDQADRAVRHTVGQAEDIFETHPALGIHLEQSFGNALENSAELIGETRRNDDGIFSQASHFVSGAIRDEFNEPLEGLRLLAGGAADIYEGANRLGGRALSNVVDGAGNYTADAFDRFGLDELGDGVRDVSDEASTRITQASEVAAEVAHDIVIGVGEGGASVVTGVREIVANPIGTVRGLGELYQNVSPEGFALDTLLNGGSVEETLRERQEFGGQLWQGVTADIRATNAEHGAVAATSHAVFDIATTIGTSGASAAGRTALTVARRLGRIGRAARSADDLAVVARLDDLGRAANVADDATRALDDVGRAADNAAQAADDVGRLGDDAGRLGDDTGRLGDDAGGRLDDVDDAGRRITSDELEAQLRDGRQPPLDDAGNPLWTSASDAAARNPFDISVRSQIRSPGFQNNPAFNAATNATIDELAVVFRNDPPTSIRSALDELDGSPIDNFRSGGADAPDSFFKPRANEIGTPVVSGNRYGNVVNSAGNFSDRIDDLIAGSPGGKDILTEIGDTPATYLRSRANGGSTIFHATPSSIDDILGAGDDAFRRALDPNTSLADTLDAVAEVNFYIAQATPFERGSASAAEAVSRSILDSRGIESSAYRVGVSPDLEAFVRPLSDFRANYVDFFEVPPRFLDGPPGV